MNIDLLITQNKRNEKLQEEVFSLKVNFLFESFKINFSLKRHLITYH